MSIYQENIYKAVILAHVDGDTSHLQIHLGFDVTVNITARWYGINAPEKSTPEGLIALQEVNTILPPGTDCIIRSLKDKKEKYGRYLIQFFDKNGNSWNDWMVNNGFAKPYFGEGSK